MENVNIKRGFSNRLIAAAEKISKYSADAVIFLILPMFILVTVDALVMRYVFNNPTIWVQELITFIFGVYFVIGGAYCLNVKKHVAMDAFYIRMSPWARKAVDVLTCTAVVVCCGVLIWIGGKRALEATLANEATQTLWRPILWPPLWAIPIGAIMLILQAFGNLFLDLRTKK